MQISARPRPTGYPNTESRPTWSPDSQRVIAEVGHDTVVAERKAPSEHESFGEIPTWVNDPDWNPQGDKVAFSAFTPRPENPKASWGVYTCDAEGKNYKRILNDAKEAEFSPQGDKIAYKLKKDGMRDRLAVSNADGSGAHPVSKEGILLTDWSWDPSGQQVVYDTYADGRFQIRVTDFTGKKDRQLTDGEGGFYKDRTPEWSPLGDKVLFERHDRVMPWSELWTVDVRTGAEKQVLGGFPGRAYDPAWSPDGKTIAFVSNMAGGSETDLYLMDSDGKNLERISALPGDEYAPSWSPDGDAIAFTRLDWNKHDEGRYSLHIHEVNQD